MLYFLHLLHLEPTSIKMEQDFAKFYLNLVQFDATKIFSHFLLLFLRFFVFWSYSKIMGSKTGVKRVQKVPKFFGYQNSSIKSLSCYYHVLNVISIKIAKELLLLAQIFSFLKGSGGITPDTPPCPVFSGKEGGVSGAKFFY